MTGDEENEEEEEGGILVVKLITFTRHDLPKRGRRLSSYEETIKYKDKIG